MAFSGAGAGTELDPFIITTANQLQEMNDYLGTLGVGTFWRLGNNIDLSVEPYGTSPGWIPIGFNATDSFRGRLDGNNKKILNLFMDRPGNNGLFGYINNIEFSEVDYLIKDLIIEDAIIMQGGSVLAHEISLTTPTRTKIKNVIVTNYERLNNVSPAFINVTGALDIENCKMSITSNRMGGCFIGSLGGSLSFCSVNVNINANNYEQTGVLVNSTSVGNMITDCITEGNINLISSETINTGNILSATVSGLVLYLSFYRTLPTTPSIQRCVSRVNININLVNVIYNVAGILSQLNRTDTTTTSSSYSETFIVDCINEGNIITNTGVKVAGIFSYLRASASQNAVGSRGHILRRCINKGNISGVANVAGVSIYNTTRNNTSRTFNCYNLCDKITVYGESDLVGRISDQGLGLSGNYSRNDTIFERIV